MKDKFLKLNDLFTVLLNGWRVFFVFFILSIVFSGVYSYFHSFKYNISTIIKTEKIKHVTLNALKMRFDNGYYFLDLAKHFNTSPQSLPSFKINVVKFFSYVELSVDASKNEVERNKKYLEFLQKKVMDDLVERSSVLVKYPPYKDLIETQDKQIKGYRHYIVEAKKQLAIYEKKYQESLEMLKEYDTLNLEWNADSNNSINKNQQYVFKYIHHDILADVDLLPSVIDGIKQRLTAYEDQLELVIKQKDTYEQELKEIENKDPKGVLVSGVVSVEKDIAVVKNDAEFLRSFVLFFSAMMFLALGVVFLKEIVKE